jgi:hypothetical protein
LDVLRRFKANTVIGIRDILSIFSDENASREDSVYKTPKSKADQSDDDDEDTPLVLRRQFATSAKESGTQRRKIGAGDAQEQPNSAGDTEGRRPRRASAQKRKKTEQPVVISSSDGHVSEEDSSPSSEWEGSEAEDRPNRRRKKIAAEESEASNSASGSDSLPDTAHQASKLRTSKRTSRDRAGKPSLSRYSHQFFFG